MRATFRDTIAVLNQEARNGAFVAGVLRRLPRSDWHTVVAANPEWRSFGVAEALLLEAHEALDRDPSDARAITLFVLRHLLPTPFAAELKPLHRRLVGTAWKEYASACFALKRLRPCIAAAQRARTIFDKDPGLALEAAEAVFVLAQAYNERAQRAEALHLLDSCERTFASFGHRERLMQTLMMRAIVHYDLGRPEGALREFLRAREEAQRQQNKRELSRIHHNLGVCSFDIGKQAIALEYLRRALLEFMDLAMDAEVQRALWMIGRVTKRNDPELAAAEMQRASAELRARGMTAVATRIDTEVAEMAR